MKKKILAGAIVASMMLPVFASAQTSTQSQIEALLGQIRALQEQLKTLLINAASTTRMEIRDEFKITAPGQVSKLRCIMLARNLRIGAQGDDVRELQEMLMEDRESDFRGKVSGFFGPLTARAMAKWQIRLGIASTTDGIVGPLTRGFFERTCGKGLGEAEDDDIMRGKIRGEITSVATSTITLKATERSVLVNITGSTTIRVLTNATSTPTVGSMADLTAGKSVAVEGVMNADGSITAYEIKVGQKPQPPPKRIKLRFDHRGKKMMDDDEDDD